jgi:hypothetical protein
MDQTRHSIFLHLPHPHGELCHRLWIAPSWRFCRPRPRMHAAAGHATARTDGSPKSPTDSSTSHNTIRVVRIVCNTYHTSSIPDFEPKGTLLGPGTSLGMCPIMWTPSRDCSLQDHSPGPRRLLMTMQARPSTHSPFLSN